MRPRTKIVATLGPSSHTDELIEKMVEAGMSVARLNFSHGDHNDHSKLIRSVRRAEGAQNIPIPIIQDLQGPKIRLGELPEKGIELTTGTTVVFDASITRYHEGTIPLDFPELSQYVKVHDRLFLIDGRIETRISKIQGKQIYADVIIGGHILSHKGINVPDTDLPISALTEKDKKDALFGIEKGVEYIALSFVQRPEDILDLKYFLQEKIAHHTHARLPHIIAKIERREGIKRIHDILAVADGIMIARGDLGVEVPPEEVPLIQKKLIDAAIAVGKPAIVATQMLDSMQQSPRPTRAEVTDVANAVVEHADALMLSNETATGAYPVESVDMMRRIIQETESSRYAELPLALMHEKKHPVDTIMSRLSRLLAEETNADLILTASLTGDTARLISRYRPNLPIAVATSSVRVERQMNLLFGVVPFVLPHCRAIEELVERSIVHLTEEKIIKKGQRIVVVAGEPIGEAGQVNFLEVREVS